MKTGVNGLQLIRTFEGCRLKAYICPAGVPTVGYGHTGGVKVGQTITRQQADDLLKKDLEKFEKAINALVKVPLNQNQFDVLISFVFNVGVSAFEHSTLLKLLNEKKYNEVPVQLSRWNKAGSTVLTGLTRRRKAEGILFSQGKLEL